MYRYKISADIASGESQSDAIYILAAALTVKEVDLA